MIYILHPLGIARHELSCRIRNLWPSNLSPREPKSNSGGVLDLRWIKSRRPLGCLGIAEMFHLVNSVVLVGLWYFRSELRQDSVVARIVNHSVPAIENKTQNIVY